MQKLFILVFSLFVAGQAVAQGPSMDFGAWVTIQYCDVFYHNDGTVPDAVESLLRKDELADIGYNGGVYTEIPFRPRLSLRIGFGYNGLRFKSEIKNLTYQHPEPTFPRAIQFFYQHNYITVPVLLRYKTSYRTTNFYLVGGGTALYNTKNKKVQQTWYTNGEVQVTPEDYEPTGSTFRKMNVTAQGGFGVEWGLSAGLALLIQPTFEYHIFGLAKEASLNRNAYTAGLNVSLLFQ